MKKLFIASSIALCLTAALIPTVNAGTYSDDPVLKKTEKKNEAIGFGSGAVAGGLIAGPIGAVVGGLFGLIIADDVNDENQMDNANHDLAQANSHLEHQQQSIIALQTDIQKMQRKQMIQLASYSDESNNEWLNEIAQFETNLQFKTASFVVEDVYKSQLRSLASILTSYPQLEVKVTGFADQRGDSKYNESLSEQRAQAVKQYLLGNNVNASQINISGEGETSVIASKIVDGAVTGPSHEDLFFARKVNVKLVKPNQQMTAAN